jgi:hypothetical protein
VTEGRDDGNFFPNPSMVVRQQQTCLRQVDHFGGTTPFKVQVNFDIPIFEGQIDVDALEKWLNMLEGYFSIHNFLIGKISPLRSLRLSPMSKIGGRLTVRKIPQRSLECLRLNPLGTLLWMSLRNNITLLETMMTST